MGLPGLLSPECRQHNQHAVLDSPRCNVLLCLHASMCHGMHRAMSDKGARKTAAQMHSVALGMGSHSWQALRPRPSPGHASAGAQLRMACLG